MFFIKSTENCDVRVSVCLALKRILQPPSSYPLLVLTTLNHYSFSFPSFSLSSFISLPLGSLEILSPMLSGCGGHEWKTCEQSSTILWTCSEEEGEGGRVAEEIRGREDGAIQQVKDYAAR